MRNRIVIIVIRVILGLMFVGSGISGLYAGTHNMSGIPEAMIPSSQALWNTGIFQMIKVTEVVAGLMLVTGFLPWLAAIFVAPICVGIFVFDISAHVEPSYYISAFLVTALTACLGYAYWPSKYKQLFVRV